jgi:HPt (histidine-containing phosphotransfer) domain-containing protein
MGKLYNLDYLNEISSGDKDFILDMLKDFVDGSSYNISEIERLANLNDWENLYKIVHKIIPSFEFVGAESLKNDLMNLEHYSKTKEHTEQIPQLITNIKKFCNQVVIDIKTDFNL